MHGFMRFRRRHRSTVPFSISSLLLVKLAFQPSVSLLAISSELSTISTSNYRNKHPRAQNYETDTAVLKLLRGATLGEEK